MIQLGSKDRTEARLERYLDAMRRHLLLAAELGLKWSEMRAAEDYLAASVLEEDMNSELQNFSTYHRLLIHEMGRAECFWSGVGSCTPAMKGLTDVADTES